MVAHFAFKLGPRHQGGHGIDHQHVEGGRAHQGIGDLQRLFAGVGLGKQQLVCVDAELVGVNRIKRVFGIDEGAGAAQLLRLGERMERQRRLAGAFGAVNLDDAAAGQAADAERDIEADGAGRHDIRLDHLALAEAHDRALAEGALDLRDGRFQGLVLVLVHGFLFHQTQQGF